MIRPGQSVTLPTGGTATVLEVAEDTVKVQLAENEFGWYPISAFDKEK